VGSAAVTTAFDFVGMAKRTQLFLATHKNKGLRPFCHSPGRAVGPVAECVTEARIRVKTGFFDGPISRGLAAV
jgi:hypothetical protein